MEEFLSFMGAEVAPLINSLILTIVGGVFTYLGYKARQFFDKREIQEALKTNEELALISVKYVEQVAKHLAGPKKYHLAVNKLSVLAKERNISISPEEVEVLVESAVLSFKEGLKTDVLIEKTASEDYDVTTHVEGCRCSHE